MTRLILQLGSSLLFYDWGFLYSRCPIIGSLHAPPVPTFRFSGQFIEYMAQEVRGVISRFKTGLLNGYSSVTSQRFITL